MTDDRYVIVYRDGYVGQVVRQEIADLICDHARLLPEAYKSLPAYRIRIREKQIAASVVDAIMLRNPLATSLDPLKALREVTGRTTIAGAEK